MIKFGGVSVGLDVWPLVVVTIAPIGYFLIRIIYLLFYSPLAKIPGPWYAAISRFWLAKVSIQGRQIFAVHELHQKYGPFVRISPTEIAISHLESAKKIHSTKDPYRKSDWYTHLTGGPFNIFSVVHNEDYIYRRKTYGTALSNTNLNTLEPAIRKHTNIWVSKIKRDIEKDKVDILPWNFLMAADIIAEISYGKDLGMLKNEAINPIVETLATLLTRLSICAEIPAFNIIQYLLSFVPHPIIQRYIGHKKLLVDYFDKALSELRCEVQNSQDDDPRPIVFSKFVNDMEKTEIKYKFTWEELIFESVGVLNGGIETTGVTGTYLIWAVLKHPKVRRKLEEELDALSGEITDGKLRQLPYLKCVINETLRL